MANSPAPWLPFRSPRMNLPSEFKAKTPTPTLGSIVNWKLDSVRKCAIGEVYLQGVFVVGAKRGPTIGNKSRYREVIDTLFFAPFYSFIPDTSILSDQQRVPVSQ